MERETEQEASGQITRTLWRGRTEAIHHFLKHLRNVKEVPAGMTDKFLGGRVS